jgi:glutamyl-tRNA reductase
MDSIILIGLNHKTASVNVRECLAFSDQESHSALCEIRGIDAIDEAVLFSTCNRVELLLTANDADLAISNAKFFLAKFKQVPLDDFESTLYLHRGEEAVRHIFRVAASLDSMVVGEPQILGQVKNAYRAATEEKTSGVVLNRLLHRTFFISKRIRTETGIGDHAVSISYAAIELARKIFGELAGKKVMLIGAGEMAELAVEHLIHQKSDDITVANRTFERGVELADKYKGTPIRFQEIYHYLSQVDIIISSTGSQEYVLDKKSVKGIMRSRRNRPIFFIDIAVPRDIDPAINTLSNAYVYDIDDLQNVVDDNIEDRNKEAVKAERIIDEAVIHFQQWFQNLGVVPTIKALRTKINAVAQAEVEKTVQQMEHLSKGDIKSIERMTRALVNKILHDPTHYLKSNGCQGDRANSLDITRKLFRLDEENPEGE